MLLRLISRADGVAGIGPVDRLRPGAVQTFGTSAVVMLKLPVGRRAIVVLLVAGIRGFARRLTGRRRDLVEIAGLALRRRAGVAGVEGIRAHRGRPGVDALVLVALERAIGSAVGGRGVVLRPCARWPRERQ